MTEPAGDQLTTPIGIDELTAADVDDVWELFRRLPDRDRTFVEHALAVAVEEGLAEVVVEVVADQESTIGLFTRLGFRAEALLVDRVRDPDGNDSDLLVLAHRPTDDRRSSETVGLDVPLD
jgi:hypothetical protein